MLRRLMILAGSALLIVGAAQALAHERFRVVGTVTKKTATELEVTTIKDNRKMIVDVNKKTKFTRDKKPIAPALVKVGSSVVVDALGDDEFDLVAQEVRLVAAIPAPAPQKPPTPR